MHCFLHLLEALKICLFRWSIWTNDFDIVQRSEIESSRECENCRQKRKRMQGVCFTFNFNPIFICKINDYKIVALFVFMKVHFDVRFADLKLNYIHSL